MFDVTFEALLDDLAARGLLDETLVVAVGEMGRTARFNGSGGRDHWGNVFSFVAAGAGIRAGIVHGASDKNGAEPASDRVQPDELSATIFHLLGIGHEAFFPDRFGRPQKPSRNMTLLKALTRRSAGIQGGVARAPAYPKTNAAPEGAASGRT